MKKRILCAAIIAISLLWQPLSAQTSFTWNGSVSSDWGTASNWTPDNGLDGDGIPNDADDNATIVAAANNPVLNVNTGINHFTINSGTLDLNGKTLTVSGNGNGTGGSVNNGTINFNGAGSALSLSSVTFGATVQASCSSIGISNCIFNQNETLVANSYFEVTNSVFNGTANLTSSTHLLRLLSSTFNQAGTFSGAGLRTDGSTYESTADFTQTGAYADASEGNNLFKGITTFTHNGTGGYILLGNNNPDTFETDVTFTINGIGEIYVAYYSTGNLFKGKVTATSKGTGYVRFAEAVPATAGVNAYFNDDVFVNSLNTGYGILVGYSGGKSVLATGKTLNVGSEGFTVGGLYLYGFTQLGSTAQNLSLVAPNVLLYLGSPSNRSVFNGSVNFKASRLFLNGATYNGTADLEKTGDNSEGGEGSNVFNGITHITVSGNYGNLQLANAFPDTFYTDATFNVTSISGSLQVANNSPGNAFYGTATFNNSGINPTTSTSSNLYVAYGSNSTGTNFYGPVVFNNTGSYSTIYVVYYGSGTTFHSTATFNNSILGSPVPYGSIQVSNYATGTLFNDDIIVSSTNGDVSYGNGIYFCNGGGGNATLADGKKILIGSGGYTGGYLYLGAFTQLGATPQSLNMTGTSYLYIGRNGTYPPSPADKSVFNGNVDFTAPRLSLSGATYNGTADLEKTGDNGEGSEGGNIFNGITHITLSGNNSSLVLANNFPDIFYTDATFNCTGTSSYLYVAHNSTGNAFHGTATFNSSGVNPTTSTASYLYVAHNSPSTIFYGPAVFNNTGSNSYISVAYYPLGTIFNGTATFNNSVLGSPTPYGNIQVSNAATGTLFNDDIIVSSNNGEAAYSGGVYFCNGGGGNATLADGKKILIGSGGFTAGYLYLGAFTQLGATPQSLNMTGTSYLYIGRNGTYPPSPADKSVFNGNVNFTAPRIALSGATYNGTADFEKNGINDGSGEGGNIFNGVTNITNSGDNGYLLLGGTFGDIFNADVTFNNTGINCYLYVAYNSPGNIFWGDVTFNNSGANPTTSTGSSIYIGAGGITTGTTFHNPATFNNTGSNSYIYVSYGSTGTTFNSTATFNNSILASPTPYGNIQVAVHDTAAVFNDDIIVSSDNGEVAYSAGIYFCPNTGRATLADGKKILIGSGGYTTGWLYLGAFTQLGTTPQSLTVTGTSLLYAGRNGVYPPVPVGRSVFNGNVDFKAPRLFLSGAVYNGTADFEKNGENTDYSEGNNIFNGVTTVTLKGSNNLLALANGFGDVFNADVTFNNLSTSNQNQSGDIEAARYSQGNIFNGKVTLNNTGARYIYLSPYSSNTLLNGDIVTNSLSPNKIQFATGSTIYNPYITISGNAAQTMSGTTLPYIRKMLINKASGDFTVHNGFTLSDTLELINGDIVLNAANITFEPQGKVLGATQNSYVQTLGTGVVRKKYNQIGTSFLYPVGDSIYYTPMNIDLVATSFIGNDNIAVRVVDGTEPHLLCLQDYISRYWVVTKDGMSNPNLNYTYQYADDDIVGNESLIKAINWNAEDNLTSIGTVNTAANTLTANTISLVGNFTGDKSIEDFVDAGFTARQSSCANSVIIFTSDREQGNHFWNFGDGNTSTFASPDHAYQSVSPAQTYTVTHTVSTDCNAETETQTINVIFTHPVLSTTVGSRLGISTDIPDDASVCQASELFTVTITNNSSTAVDSLYLNLKMPVGMKYLTGTVSGMTEADNTIFSEPLFFLPTLAANSSVTVTFSAEACCAIIDFKNAGNPIINNTRVDYKAGTTWYFDTEQTPSSYNIEFPVLTITDAHISPSTFEGMIGEKFLRSIRITNSGDAPVSELVLIDNHTGVIQINSVTLGTKVTNGTVDSIFISSADLASYFGNSGFFPPHTSLTDTQEVELLCGAAGSGESKFRVLWGCIDENCNSNDPNATASANVTVIPGGGPTLTLQETFPKEVCYSSSVHIPHTLLIRNTGTTDAQQVKIVLRKNDRYTFTDIVPNSFSVRDADGNLITLVPDSIVPMDPVYKRCPEATIGEVYFNLLPDVPVNDTILFYWESFTCCPDSQYCGSYIYNNYITSDVSYADPCIPDKRITNSTTESVETSIMFQTYDGPIDIFKNDTVTLVYINTGISLWSGDSTKQIRVKFNIEPGLFYVDSSFTWLFPNSIGDGITFELQPDEIIINGPNDGYTASTEVIGVFNFPPLPEFQFTNYFDYIRFYQSEIKIDVASACPAPATTKITENITYVPSLNCADTCEIPVLCREEILEIHCPGCRRQGIHSLAYSIQRTNYGLADNNNDGVADASGTIDLNKIKTNRAMVGDTLTATLNTAVVISGDYNPWSFPYEFKYGYYSQRVENGKFLTVLDATVELYDASTNTNYTFIIPAGSVQVTDQGGGIIEYFYDYSIDSLHQYGIPLSYDKFDNEDELIFHTPFRVTGNVYNYGIALPSQVFTHIYLGAIPHPSCDPDICLPDENGEVDVCGRTLPQCDSTVQYYCTKLGGIFSLVGHVAAAWTSDSYQTGKTCEQQIAARDHFYVMGGVGTNIFPFEYRNWANVDTLIFAIPSGFQYTSALLDITRTAGSALSAYEIVSITPDEINGDTLIFYTGKYFTDNPAYASYSDSLLYLSDESFYVTVYVNLANTCHTQQNIFLPYSDRVSTGYVPSLAAELVTDTIVNPAKGDFNLAASVIFRAPDLDITSALPTKDGIEKEVCWNITINNAGTHGDKVWLAAVSPSGNLNVTHVFEINSNGDRISADLSVVNDIYQVGLIYGSGGNRRFQICATYSCTAELTADNLLVYTGWSCSDFPTSLDSIECPASDVISLFVQPKQAGLQASVTGASDIDLCNPIPYEIFINSPGVGTVNDIKVRITLPSATGLLFQSGSGKLQFPYPSAPFVSVADPVNIGGNTLEWNLSSLNTYLANNGLKGGGFIPDSSQLKLGFNFITDCNFTAGDVIRFEVSGISNCGDTIVLNSQTEPLTVIGFPQVTRMDVDISATDFNDCTDNNSIVYVSMVNTGDLPTGTEDTFRFVLPVGMSFIAGSFNGIYNAPANPVPYQAGQDLKWQLPDSILPGDSIVFTFEIMRDNDAVCGTFLLKGASIVKGDVSCANTGTCDVSAINGQDTHEIKVITPDAGFTVISSGCSGDEIIFTSNPVECGTHFWDFGDGNTSTDASPTHTYNSPGTYTVTHSVITGCTTTVAKTVTIQSCCNEFTVTAISGNISCYGANDGFIDVTVTGTPPFQFTWSNGATTEDLSGLAAGTYTVEVTDASACSGTLAVTLTEPDALSASIIGKDVDCNPGCNGAADLTVSGGTAPYIFSWSDGATTEDLSDLCSGDYSVTVTDASGCMTTADVYLSEPGLPQVSCNDITIGFNQELCGNFELPEPDTTSECAIATLQNDYPGGPFPVGTTTVTWTVTDTRGNQATCTQNVTYQPGALLSSYGILGLEKVTLMPNNNVQTGSVGVMAANGVAYMQNYTQVISAGSFVQAANISTFPNTNIAQQIFAPASVALPVFETNPFSTGPDVSVPVNSTMTLTGSNYGTISLEKGATVIFTSGEINIQTIRVNNKAAGSGTTVKFSQCTRVRVKGRVDMGPSCTINPDGYDVIFYVAAANTTEMDNQPATDIGPNSVVNADFFVPYGHFYAHSGSNTVPARYTGTFIAKWITGDPDIIWNVHPNCEEGPYCPAAAKTIAENEADENGSITADNFKIAVYPNPFTERTNIIFSLTTTEKVKVELYNVQGEYIQTLFNNVAEDSKPYTVEVNAKNLPAGFYFFKLSSGTINYTGKLTVIK